MKDIRSTRKAVATMANQLHKRGYSLSNAFRTAWRQIKSGMKIRVSGVTQGKRQELLQFIAGRKPEELSVYLQRDRVCTYRVSAQRAVAEHGSSHRGRCGGGGEPTAGHWRIQLQGNPFKIYRYGYTGLLFEVKFYIVSEHLPDDSDKLAGTVPEGIIVSPAFRHLGIVALFFRTLRKQQTGKPGRAGRGIFTD